MIQTPDPFRPGQFLTVRDPEAIVNASGHEMCPVCNALRDRLNEQAAFNRAFALVDPDATVPL